jgi:molybdate transport system regulatory protein
MRSVFKLTADMEVVKNGTLFLNGKRIALLKQIRHTGSILAASKVLGMSYQMAWTYIKEINAVSPLPVVKRQRGGVNGGGAEVTEYGHALVGKFLLIEQKHSEYLFALEDEMDLCFSGRR